MRISFASSPFPVSVDACRGSGDWSWCFWVVQVFLPVVRGDFPSWKLFVFSTPTSSSLFTCMSPALSAMCACFFVALDFRICVLQWSLCLCVIMPSLWVRRLVQRIVVRRSKSHESVCIYVRLSAAFAMWCLMAYVVRFWKSFDVVCSINIQLQILRRRYLKIQQQVFWGISWKDFKLIGDRVAFVAPKGFYVDGEHVNLEALTRKTSMWLL